MRFKEFLAEAIIKKWKTEDVDVEKAIEYLNEHCKDGLKAIANGNILYRGFTKTPFKGSAYVKIDPSTGERTSKDTNNLYQLMIEASPGMASVTKRSKSLICSADRSTAVQYGDLAIVFPHDGTTLCAIKGRDIFNQQIKSIPTLNTISSFTRSIGVMFMRLDVTSKVTYKPDGAFNQEISIAQMNNKLAQVSPEEFIVAAFSILNGSLRNGELNAGEVKSLDIRFQMQNSASGLGSLKYRNGLYKIMRKEGYTCTGFLKKLDDAFKNAPKGERFNAISGVFFPNPKSINLSMIKFSDALPSTVSEVWFSGPALMISRPCFIGILKEMVNQGMPISPKIVKQFKLEQKK